MYLERYAIIEAQQRLVLWTLKLRAINIFVVVLLSIKIRNSKLWRSC